MTEFPFAAVVGQEALKTALLLNVINPRIGGVLISGPKGSAKSTLARALAAILPASAEGSRPPFVTLPLGASEERLTGSLDLQRVLSEGETHFHEGLLAKAHDGVLYVDEVNLLPDPLVDLLLDVAASGVNIVERDGISHSHPARFSLIGTMNPDEGELRPQLLDRFGLCLEQSAVESMQERVAIVRQREAFDRDPQAFVDQHRATQTTLTQRILRAQQLLNDVTAAPWVYEHIAARCEAAGVEGLRADLTWHRAAQAHAAWRDATTVSQQDIDIVEPWVLAHRRRTTSPATPPTPPPPESGTPPPSSGQGQANSEQDMASGPTGSSQTQGQWGAMPPVSQHSVSMPMPDVPKSTANAAATASSSRLLSGNRRGHQRGQRRSHDEGSQPDWFATLTENRGQWPWRRLRYRRARTGQPILHLILLDTSGSTLGQRLLGRAKGLVDHLARQAYAAREQIAILGFGNDGITPILPRRRAPKDVLERLDATPGGGGTPIREAVLRAARLIRQWRRQDAGLQVRTYLITDGRTRQSLAGLPSLGECVVLDTEQSAVKRGRGRQLAEQLGAGYRPLPRLESL